MHVPWQQKLLNVHSSRKESLAAATAEAVRDSVRQPMLVVCKCLSDEAECRHMPMVRARVSDRVWG